MATRPRTGSSRTPKAPPPAPSETSVDPAPLVAAGTDSGGTQTDAGEITAAHLERREIPSFSESREARIAEAAYWRAERRGFTAGQELDDWLAAEREVDEEIAGRESAREQ